MAPLKKNEVYCSTCRTISPTIPVRGPNSRLAELKRVLTPGQHAVIVSDENIERVCRTCLAPVMQTGAGQAFVPTDLARRIKYLMDTMRPRLDARLAGMRETPERIRILEQFLSEQMGHGVGDYSDADIEELYIQLAPPIPADLVYVPAGPGLSPGQERTSTIPGDASDPARPTTWQEDFEESLKYVFTGVDVPKDPVTVATAAAKTIPNLVDLNKNIANYEDENKKLIKRYMDYRAETEKWRAKAYDAFAKWAGNQRALLMWDAEAWDPVKKTRGAVRPKEELDRIMPKVWEVEKRLREIADGDVWLLWKNYRHAKGNRLSTVSGYY